MNTTKPKFDLMCQLFIYYLEHKSYIVKNFILIRNNLNRKKQNIFKKKKVRSLKVFDESFKNTFQIVLYLSRLVLSSLCADGPNQLLCIVLY